MEVGEDVTTVNGDITLEDGTQVAGSIIVKKRRGWWSKHRELDIRLEGGSVVKGDILVKDDDMTVTVYLEGGSEVLGEIRNAKVVKT